MSCKQENLKKEKKAESSGFYSQRPIFGNKGPSVLRQRFSRGMTFFLVIAASIVFYFALLRLPHLSEAMKKIYHVLKPVLYGCVIAFLLNPIVKLVEKNLRPFLMGKMKNKKRAHGIARGTGIFVAVAVMLFIVFTLFNMMIPELYRSIRDMILTVPSQLTSLVNQITEMNTKDTTISQLMNSILKESTDYIQKWMRSDLLAQINILMSNLTVGVINVISELFNAILGIIISVYILFSKEVFAKQAKKIIYALFNTSHANLILHLTIKSNYIFGGFLIGKIIDSAIIGVICFAGLSILNMPYTLLVSVIVGVTNVIPFFGPYIGAVPSAILILLADPQKGIYFIIFIILLQQLDGNIIGPKILGDYTGLSVFWVVFAILLGGGLFGFAGMILGVPTFAVIYYVVQMLIENKLSRKNLPTQTEAYGSDSFVNAQGQYVKITNEKQEVETIKNEKTEE